ncbi:hypothetical protein [Corynebacterium uterequi]|uniref:Cell division protein FtsL n=1 Tax=Corynebacterium uterequi TaxID=1072256 RepID=A0A0G3HFE1_9CORY|nr:hypothetical protein [Corynebacterium uterequi]AKK11465.1 hypothetical protein CUTER_07380 [Corynebacterium uterequi]
MATTVVRQRQERTTERQSGRSRDFSSPDGTLAPPPRVVRPRRDDDTITRRRGSRIGSRQVVSERGRRVSAGRAPSMAPRLTATAFAVALAGIALLMWLTGLATSQTFAIDRLVAEEGALAREVESLNRDVQEASSVASITRRATELGMVIPEQPAVLSVDDAGVATVTREGTPDTVRIGGTEAVPQPQQASSDPAETRDVNPQPIRPAAPEPPSIGLAPYASGGN